MNWKHNLSEIYWFYDILNLRLANESFKSANAYVTNKSQITFQISHHENMPL